MDSSVTRSSESETDYTAQLFAGDTSAALLAQLIGVIILNLVASNLLTFFRQLTSAKINRNMRTVVLDKVIYHHDLYCALFAGVYHLQYLAGGKVPVSAGAEG